MRCPSCGQVLPAGYASTAKRPSSRRDENYAGSKASVSLGWRPGEVILGQYEVLGLVGRGGMGRVYRVRHRAWHRDLALKVPRRSIFQHEHGAANFTKECETWAGLGLHPHIVSCYFVRRFTGVPLVFVEYVDGGSLHEWITSRKLYAGESKEVLERVLDIAIQTAWGLEHAHGLGIVHMDMKPANVLIQNDGLAKITDFGLSKARALAGETISPKTSILVSAGGMTPAYCSPEQQRGETVSKKTDIWSWAVSVLEMFVGEVTWMSGVFAAQALEMRLAPGMSQQPDRLPLPKEVVHLLRHCFMADPLQRPASMQEIAGRLVDIYHSLTGQAYPRSMPDPASGKMRVLRAASLNNRAVSLIELDHLQEAARLLRKGFTAPETASAPGLLQDIAYNYALLQVRHNASVTVEQIAKAVPAGTDTRRQAFLLGMLFLEMGELYRAIDSLAEAVESAALYQVDALNARGIALLLTGETQPAIISFQAAVDRAGDRLDIVRNLALAYYYDRQIARALQIFDTLVQSMVFGGDDAIRYATVLSAAGYLTDADQYIQRAISAPELSSATILTASELYHGVQTFLPLVMPVRPGTMDHQAMLDRVTKNEPNNLRGQIDRETLPDRLGYRGGAVVRKRKRVLYTGSDAARVGGSLSASYSALTRRHRWGNVNTRLGRWMNLLIAFGLAVVVAFCCALVLKPFDLNRIPSMQAWNDPYARVLIPIKEPIHFCIASMVRRTGLKKAGPDNPLLLDRIEHGAAILRGMAAAMEESGEDANPLTEGVAIRDSRKERGADRMISNMFYSFQTVQRDLWDDLHDHWIQAEMVLDEIPQTYLLTMEKLAPILVRVLTVAVFLVPALLLLRGAPSRRIMQDLIMLILGPIAVLLVLAVLSVPMLGTGMQDVFHDFFTGIARIQSLSAAFDRRGTSRWEGGYAVEVDQSLTADVLALAFTVKSLLQMAVAMSLVFIASQVCLQVLACARRSRTPWREVVSRGWEALRRPTYFRAPRREGAVQPMLKIFWRDRWQMTIKRLQVHVRTIAWGSWDVLLAAEYIGFAGTAFLLTGFGPAVFIALIMAMVFALGVLFRPSLLLLANFIAIELAFFGYFYGTLVASPIIEQARHAGMDSVFSTRMVLFVAANLVFILVSLFVLRRCPEYAPEWDTCRPDPWDIRQVVDPLNIRLHAAPWQITQLDAESHSQEARP